LEEIHSTLALWCGPTGEKISYVDGVSKSHLLELKMEHRSSIENLTPYHKPKMDVKFTRLKSEYSMKTIYISVSLCAVLSAIAGASFLLFDPLVKQVVLSRLVLRNSSEIAELWENPPIIPHLKVYFFNLTNPEEFFAGKSQPNLQEVGPYTYHQKWIKENIKWYDNGTMSYQTRKEFKFVPELSHGHHEEDLIITANVPVISAFYQMKKGVVGLDWILGFLGYRGWVEHTAEELVWGYEEPLFELAKMAFPNAPNLTKFGFFAKKNASEDLSTYTMYTGEVNPYNLSKISMYNGQSSLNKWSQPECNEVQGSDGATFNPYIQKTDTLWFFNEELCRSLPMVFDQEVTHSGNLPGYRFSPRPDVFMTPRTAPENMCYCDGKEKELCDMIGDGMFAISSCQFDAPIILSWPHFLYANQSYINSVKGLQPDADRHSFYFEVQPVTGTTLAAKARVQINLGIKNNPAFSAVKNVKDTVLPLLWFEEGLDELGPDLLTLIGQAVLSPPIYKNYLLCVMMGLCVATLVLFLICLTQLILNRQRRRTLRRQLNIKLAASDDHNDFLHVHGDGKLLQVCNILRDTCSAKVQLRHPQLSKLNGSFSSIPIMESQTASTDSSRLVSASHSRNSSTGSTLPFVNQEDVENKQTLLHPKTKQPNSD